MAAACVTASRGSRQAAAGSSSIPFARAFAVDQSESASDGKEGDDGWRVETSSIGIALPSSCQAYGCCAARYQYCTMGYGSL
ncbi:unnamed protein product [Urochloa humidicola]